MADSSEETAASAVNEVRRKHGMSEYGGQRLPQDIQKEDRAQALHLACMTVGQNQQALEQGSEKIIKRAQKFYDYIREGTL